MPKVYIRPEIKNENSDKGKFQCPVFMNKARQVCPFMLALNSNDPPMNWISAGTALILDPGEKSGLALSRGAVSHGFYCVCFQDYPKT